MRRKLLLVANHPAFNKNMLRWAHVLEASGTWQPVVFSTAGSMEGLVGQMGLRDLSTLYPPPGLGWQDSTAEPNRESAPPPSAIRSRVKSALPQFLEPMARTAYLAVQIRRKTSELRRQVRYVVELLRRERIDAVLLSETSPAYGAPVFVKAARACGIPVVTTPIDHYGVLDHAELYLTDEVLNANRGLKAAVARRRPRWAMLHKGRRMIRVRLDLLLAFEWLGWASPKPWHMVGAWEDAIASTGPAMRDFYLGEGLPAQQLRLVGSPELDLMHRVRADADRLKPALLRELGLDTSKPVILTGMVANHYLAGRPDAEYETYEQLVEGWIKPLAALSSHNVVVNLHPSQRVEDYRYIEQWGVRICQQDITTLIPLSDIYVACSSTARLAIACGIPLVYYDVFRYSDAMPTLNFPNAGGTVMVTTRNALIDVMTRLTGDPVYFATMRARQEASAAHWGTLDGQSATRLTDLIDSLIDAPHE